jgi:hypothetical protein
MYAETRVQALGSDRVSFPSASARQFRVIGSIGNFRHIFSKTSSIAARTLRLQRWILHSVCVSLLIFSS